MADRSVHLGSRLLLLAGVVVCAILQGFPTLRAADAAEHQLVGEPPGSAGQPLQLDREQIALMGSEHAAELRAWNAEDGSRPAIHRTSHAGAAFQECGDCPVMVVAPGGTYLIGSPEAEPGRGADEAPIKQITLSRGFAVSRFEVTRQEYETFLQRTGHSVKGGCVTDRMQKGNWVADAKTTLHDPGFEQGKDHPVACVSWNDAQAYIAWLNNQTGGGYRMLSESEWEFVARAGTTSAYPWGPTPEGGCPFGNIGDATASAKYPDIYPGTPWAACSDGALNTAPVGSYQGNAFGLYDLIGNVGEWVDDCGTLSYESLPSDGAADHSRLCDKRIVRGGSWGTMAKDYRVANRVRYRPDDLDDSIGIRVAKTLE